MMNPSFVFHCVLWVQFLRKAVNLIKNLYYAIYITFYGNQLKKAKQTFKQKNKKTKQKRRILPKMTRFGLMCMSKLSCYGNAHWRRTTFEMSKTWMNNYWKFQVWAKNTSRKEGASTPPHCSTRIKTLSFSSTRFSHRQRYRETEQYN